MIKSSLFLPRNFYLIATAVFLVWMLFFDSNDIYSQYQLKQKLSELENQKEYYQEKIGGVNIDREALLSDMELLEKFAREKYYMRKDGEEVFVIVEE